MNVNTGNNNTGATNNNMPNGAMVNTTTNDYGYLNNNNNTNHPSNMAVMNDYSAPNMLVNNTQDIADGGMIRQ